MVFVNSREPSRLLSDWLQNIDKTVDEAELWVSSGKPENWQWSLKYSEDFEEGYTYWGIRLNISSLRDFCEEIGKGTAASLNKMFEELMQRKKPQIVLFYVTDKIGIVGAGLVTSFEFDFLNLFWPEEKMSGNVEFPFRFKMKILWLSPFDEKGGDEEITWLLKNYTRSSLQHVQDENVVKELKEFLKKRIKEYEEKLTAITSQSLGEEFNGPEPYTTSTLSREELEGEIRKSDLHIERDVLGQITAAFNSGKHILLIGPPGTGKTTLARIIAKVFGGAFVEATASGEWSRIDVIGGPTFVGDKVQWKSGVLLRAIAESFKNKGKAVLIIDEINRANMDRAFGEFFTIFGGNPAEWYLPNSLLNEIKTFNDKIDETAKILLEEWKNQRGERLRIPESFRIIATMNVYDRRYLFSLGYALLRRFAVVPLENPENVEQVLEKHCDAPEVIGKIFDIYQGLRQRKITLGIALLLDVAKTACELKKDMSDVTKAVDNAMQMIIVPQLEGLLPSQLENVRELLKQKGFLASVEALEQLYPETTGDSGSA
ncbi:MAG: AAA family ATPase [Thermosphaera sp.]